MYNYVQLSPLPRIDRTYAEDLDCGQANYVCGYMGTYCSLATPTSFYFTHNHGYTYFLHILSSCLGSIISCTSHIVLPAHMPHGPGSTHFLHTPHGPGSTHSLHMPHSLGTPHSPVHHMVLGVYTQIGSSH